MLLEQQNAIFYAPLLMLSRCSTHHSVMRLKGSVILLHSYWQHYMEEDVSETSRGWQLMNWYSSHATELYETRNAGRAKLNRQSGGCVMSHSPERLFGHEISSLMKQSSSQGCCCDVKWLSGMLWCEIFEPKPRREHAHTSIMYMEEQLPLETCVMLICWG